MTNAAFYVFFTNHGYYAEKVFATLKAALEYGKSAHFDFQVVKTHGAHPYKTKDCQLIAAWNAIGGTRLYT